MALSTLDTPDDPRARMIADSVYALIRVRPIAVELYPAALDVIIADTTAVPADEDAVETFTKAVHKRARAVVGAEQMPETLRVSIRRGVDSWITRSWYDRRMK